MRNSYLLDDLAAWADLPCIAVRIVKGRLFIFLGDNVGLEHERHAHASYGRCPCLLQGGWTK